MGCDDGRLPLPAPGAANAADALLSLVGTAGDERERAIRKAIFDGASHLIIATDATGTIIDINPAAERQLGYRRDELVGLCTPVRLHDMAEVAAEAERLSAELGEHVPPGFDVFVARPRRGLPTEREGPTSARTARASRCCSACRRCAARAATCWASSASPPT